MSDFAGLPFARSMKQLEILLMTETSLFVRLNRLLADQSWTWRTRELLRMGHLALLWQNLAIDWRNWIPESDF
jgi:hypothetical protein